MKTLLAALAALLLAGPVLAQDNTSADVGPAAADSWAQPAAPAKPAAKPVAQAPAKAAAAPTGQNAAVATGPDDLGEQPINAAPIDTVAQDQDNADEDSDAHRGAGPAFPLIIGGLGLMALCGVALYFLPTIIALARHKRNSGAIFLVNLFLGWSFVGWIAALVWSVMTDAP